MTDMKRQIPSAKLKKSSKQQVPKNRGAHKWLRFGFWRFAEAWMFGAWNFHFMTIQTFILKNALRNKRRALLSVSSVAASLFLLVTLQVALRELTLPVESSGAELRVAVRNKISLTQPLPARQRGIIEKIPGVVGVTPFTWFGGKYKNEEGMSFRPVRH